MYFQYPSIRRQGCRSMEGSKGELLPHPPCPLNLTYFQGCSSIAGSKGALVPSPLVPSSSHIPGVQFHGGKGRSCPFQSRPHQLTYFQGCSSMRTKGTLVPSNPVPSSSNISRGAVTWGKCKSILSRQFVQDLINNFWFNTECLNRI